MIPPMSATERIALESGSRGPEHAFLSGWYSPESFRKYVPYSLSEQDNTILSRLPSVLKHSDPYGTMVRRSTPEDHPSWDSLRENGYFGLIVPEAYGGTPMSVTGLSTLLQKLASVDPSLAIHTMVPASLGPAELLSHYGTEEQKERYLPRLAAGEIPCFGLTSTDAGSDAAGSMTDYGYVRENALGKVYIELHCRKRYITLAPVAEIIGIAFKIEDPDGVLEANGYPAAHGSISLALVDRGKKNLETGPRTDPLGVGFSNGTIVGDSVVLDIDRDIIGGRAGLNKGWKYLMECLAAGRGVALPASAAGASKLLTVGVGGYAAVRKQFKRPIADFEGVQSKLADMAIRTYEIHALVEFMNSVLERKETPPVMSAIVKYQTTELARNVVNNAMDVMAGAAICMGPKNFVAPHYMGSPIGITVEGSNTMTRSLLIFGQGIVRSHPYVLDILNSIENNDRAAFTSSARGMVGNFLKRLVYPAGSGIRPYVKFFSLSSTASLSLGKSLKTMEYLSGRYADMMVHMTAYAAMEWYENNSDVDPTLSKAAKQQKLHDISCVVSELVDNHPHSFSHLTLAKLCGVGGKPYPPPWDFWKSEISEELTKPGSSIRTMFEKDIVLTPIETILSALQTEENQRQDNVKKVVEVDIFKEKIEGVSS